MVSKIESGCLSGKAACRSPRPPNHTAPGAWIFSFMLLALLTGAAGCGPAWQAAVAAAIQSEPSAASSQTPIVTDTPRPTLTQSPTLYSQEVIRHLEAAGLETRKGRLIFQKKVDDIIWLFDSVAYSIEWARELPLSIRVGDFAFHARLKVWPGLGASTSGLVFRSSDLDLTKENFYMAGFTGFAVDDEYTFSFSFYKEGVRDETFAKNTFRDATAKVLADDPQTFIAEIFIVARQSRFEFFLMGAKWPMRKTPSLPKACFNTIFPTISRQIPRISL